MISSIYSTAIPLTQVGKRKGKTKKELDSDYAQRLESMSSNGPNLKRVKSVAKSKSKKMRKTAQKLQAINKKAENRRQRELERSRQERIRLFGSDLIGDKPKPNP